MKADETLLGVLVGIPNRVVFLVPEPSATTLRRVAEEARQEPGQGGTFRRV